MKLLVISNMWPGPTKPYFGVFVATRVRGYIDDGVDVTVAANRDPRRGVGWAVVKYTSLLVRAAWAGFRHRPDVIEGHYLVPTAFITWLTARLVGRPYVLYAHGSDLSPPRLLRRPLAWVLAGAAEIHTNSDDSRVRLEIRFPGRTAEVLPAGIDLRRFRVGRGKRERILVYVGNLDHVKAPDLLLRALGTLRRIEWKCRIAGIGPMRAELEELAVALNIDDRIDWLGAVEPDEVGAVYRDARVTVVPSRRDALGQVAIESLASGTPVIVTAVGGLRSIPTAECGTVVPPNDPLSLAVAIERWLDHTPGAPTIDAARQRARAYDADRLAAHAAERLRSIIGE